MASKEVGIESMWSPAVALVKAQGVGILYAAPPEGFRGWCSAEGISSKVTDPAKLQACYDDINWNYNGYLGAVIMRQGYYIANGRSCFRGSTRRREEGASRLRSTTTGGGARRPRGPARITGKVGDIKKATRRQGGVPEAHRKVIISATLFLQEQRGPDEEGERLPLPPKELMSDQMGSQQRGGGNRRPLCIPRVRARPRRPDRGVPGRDGRGGPCQPARRPRGRRCPVGPSGRARRRPCG